ncbi:MAG: type IV toxin-antitoxin system AbiEi family antitoxin [Acidimicrobiia bacterium]|nr:type IV toxin-antitoxin system AbiEi family antitoxin [Acidimicrobiia bacterium]
MSDVTAPPGPRELADWLLARGRHWVTTTEAAELLGIPVHHVAPSLAQSRRRGHLFSPTTGLYVAIPPEFRSWGAVPAAHFVDPMMRHLGNDYYVCLLSAAEIHGFSHQRPQVFQVMTPARLRARTFGRVRIEFITSVHTSDRPADVVNTPTGTMRVSTPEATVLDLVSFPNASGALFNVATIIGDMLIEDALDVGRLAEVASDFPASIVQRTGWLLDYMAGHVDVEVDTEPLVPLASARATPTPLDPGHGRSGTLDRRWNVIVAEYPDEESS